MNKAVLAFIAILVLPGCVTEDNVVDLDESQSDDGELQGLNICLLYTSDAADDP